MKVDHVAIQVDDIYEACGWYKAAFDAKMLYHDDTWAILELDNIKLALVLTNHHKNHLAVEIDPQKYPNLTFKKHRDGSHYHYLIDPWGNRVELIDYGRNSSKNLKIE